MPINRKPSGLKVGEVYIYDGRVVTCKSLWWELDGFAFVELYDFKNDCIQEATPDEIQRWIDANRLTLHAPQPGRKVVRPLPKVNPT
jgi:hypothetical protein